MFGAQKPGAAGPIRLTTPEGEYVANNSFQSLIEDPGQTGAFLFVFEPGLKRIHVCRQLAFAPHVIPGIFVGGQDVLRFDIEHMSQLMDKPGRLLFRMAVIDPFLREE